MQPASVLWRTFWHRGGGSLGAFQKKTLLCHTQESDPNNLTYADLNFAKEKKSIRRIIELSQQSEYACIQGSSNSSSSSSSQQPTSSDNLTYADLDMVHLSKAPRRPPPRPEESSSEYASVQIQRQ
ncbi:UNVERIFIED_CONTAM: hypothetical protein H355_007549 [Colinus virginianus]|nr:hypothetical protein H355_007549 [Colinus virginianus]